MQAYYDVRDSLLNAAQTRDIVELETRFEKEKQEQKIALLEQEHRTERLWNNALLIGTLIIVIAVGIIVRLQRLRSVKAKQLLKTQQALNEQLKETDTMKSRFFANISHEFRTPLTLIVGPLEAHLKKSKLSVTEQKDLKIVQRSAYRLLDLVNQLMDLSKIEARRMELSVENGDLMEFLNMLTASFESLAEHKNIAFLRNIATIEDPVGYDKDKIEKIVTNILFNAFKFTPSGGKVAISAHLISDRRELVVCVVDTGRGIPLEEQSKVFSPFYQLKYENEDSNAGTGLGLSLVNELVKLYGGTIKLLSELNMGTCFTITLPVLQASASGEKSPAHNLVQKRLLSAADEQHDAPTDLPPELETILLVEDNIELRGFIASGFENRFRILMAIDGEHGLAKAQEYIPDVIISDVMMPKMNGMEFMKRIREDERTSHIPTILLTARADDESRITGLKLGADEYLLKPFSMNELKIRVNNVLLQRRRLAAKLKDESIQPGSIHHPNTEPSLDQKFIIRLKSITEENLSNPSFSVEMLAEKMNLSRAHLFRKVKAIINISPSEFINDLRLQRAAQLIRSKADNVAQVGYSVGYNEQSYFSKRFRKKFGVSPTDYAKQNVVQQDYL
jgi:signal transduction histidine kinase/DNA-binding response OmpR family regulator